MKRPRALKLGDTIGIAAPSSPFDRTKFLKGIRALERLGFSTFYRHDIFDQNRYLAGTDERRAEEFADLVCNKSVAAVMFARGGYGSQRIIPLLDLQRLREHQKPIVGFSDITPLLTFLRQGAGFPTFYGPVITQLGRMKGALTGEALVRALTTPAPLGPVPTGAARIIRPGKATGPLVGGCLSLINSSLGTPYAIDARGAILLIEEVNEKVYVLDRMLTQLKNSGVLGQAAGIVFGSIVPPEDEPHDVEHMIRDVLTDFAGPVIFNFPAGHIDDFVSLPLGATVELEAPEGAPPTLCYTTGLLT